MIRRHDDWATRLALHLIETEHRAPVCGAWDCHYAWAAAVEAMTGVDPTPQGVSYTTHIGAAREMKRRGFADHPSFVASLFERIEPSAATPGDCGFVATPDGPSAVIVLGDLVVGIGQQGRERRPRAELIAAFRIPG